MKNSHEESLKDNIVRSLEQGITGFQDVLLNCESADPREVFKIYDKEIKNRSISPSSTGSSSFLKSSFAPHSLISLPAADPSLSQWWFAGSGISYISALIDKRVIRYTDPCFICIGCPTIADKTSQRFNTTLFDIDTDVVKMMSAKRRNLSAIHYDIHDELQNQYLDHFDIAIVDPPWYIPDIQLSINRALTAVKDDGDIYFTFPGRLTREDIEKSRTELIAAIVECGHNIISIHHDSVLYQVPSFESRAFIDLDVFTGVPWRKGDLLHIQKKTKQLLKLNTLPSSERGRFKSFSRKPEEFRVFMNFNKSLSEGIPSLVQNYSENISTRAYVDQPDVWTTSKVGFQISDENIIEKILEYWEKGHTKKETVEYLHETEIFDKGIASKTVNFIEDTCKLWSKYSSPNVFKSPEDIASAQERSLSSFATLRSTKISEAKSDSYRPQFNRDRDRIIWSNSLRRLSDKTQLFPGKSDDTVRRRLTHTLEVMQLASTIGASLGLNNDLVEASALAHDLGHTPFGHAGEHAINLLFNSINKNLGGFNHYEHGLDIVTYIESPYQHNSDRSFFGLGLSPEILEAILKHTFHYDGHPLSSVSLRIQSKHLKLIPEGYCHLEGQAVRIADKISYFISDVEDGLRIGAISVTNLLDCHFFHRNSLFFDGTSKESGLEQFLSQRSMVIKILMEDVIQASTKNISQEEIKDPKEARTANAFLVRFSDEVSRDVNEVWKNLQSDLLFNDKKVLSVSLFAAKVVSELVLLFTMIPKLVDPSFRNNYQKLKNTDYIQWYHGKVGATIKIRKSLIDFMPFQLMIGASYRNEDDVDVPVEDLIQAKDFVCSLSDYKARHLHKELLNDAADT